MSGVSTDYFANHAHQRRFPWSLYHRPLEADLEDFLVRVSLTRPRPQVLVVGCGLFMELDRAPENLELTVVDIDPRAVQAVLDRRDPRIQSAFCVAPSALLSSLGRFDAIYAKEVIEHIVPWPPYLKGALDALQPGGGLWLSTPNYGEPWLPLIESTALELVARLSGYTRKGMHPSRFSRRSFIEALAATGFVDIDVRVVARRLALVGRARRPT